VTFAVWDQWPRGSFIEALADGDRAALLGAGAPVCFADDEVLVRQGEPGDVVYVLVSGLVKVIVAAESGAETTLTIRSRGDLIGEFALLDEKPRTATARAAGEVKALRVGGADFLSVRAKSPDMQTALTRYVLSKLRFSTERRAAERVWDAKEILAQVLYDLGCRQREALAGVSGPIRIPITQSDLGDLAGVAVSTAERVLKDLRRRGVIATRYREITVNDLDYLESIRFS
jgi:CRP/FNR family transcriptional regulator, cyclic AMP receptor protein